MIFCSWGHYDFRQLKHDCKRCDMNVPFKTHFSIKHEFAKRRSIKPCGTIQALKLLGLSFTGTHHRAIDDIINISYIFIEEWKSTGFIIS